MSGLNTHMIRPGVEFLWEDQPVRIQRVGLQITLSHSDGSNVFEAPLVDVAAALRGATPSEHTPQLHDIEARLTEAGLRRKRQDERVLFILQTGREPSAPDGSPPAPRLDPARWPLQTRRQRLAEILVQQPRERGSMQGFPVKVESEVRRIKSIEARWAERGTVVDARYLRPRRWRTSDAVMDALLEYLMSHATKSTKTATALVRGFRLHCKVTWPDLKLPSDTTLRRRTREFLNGYAVLGASAKNRISLMNTPASSEQPRLATRPGELVLFDTTKSNLWVRDPRTLREYRLDVTLAVDLATRCIVGLAITRSTTQYSIGLCLADILRPKTHELAERWTPAGEEVREQPFIGRPDDLALYESAAFRPEGAVVDNGRQYVTDYVTRQMANNRIHYEPQRSYTPTDKPQVERIFRTIKDMFESQLPGFTGGSVHELGDNPRGERLMSPGAYERRLRQCIDLYNHREHAGLTHPEEPFARFSPMQMLAVLLESTGALPDVSFDHEWVRFLPSEAVKVSPSRIRIARLNYTSPVLKALQGDPDVLRNGALRVHYDPFDLRRVWCFDADGRLHELRWRYLKSDTEQFGEFHTNFLYEKFKHLKLSRDDFEERFVELMSGAYDLSETESGDIPSLAKGLRADGMDALAALSVPQRSALTPPATVQVVTDEPTSVIEAADADCAGPAPRRRRRAPLPVYGRDLS